MVRLVNNEVERCVRNWLWPTFYRSEGILDVRMAGIQKKNVCLEACSLYRISVCTNENLVSSSDYYLR
jgi:hypothetical protein